MPLEPRNQEIPLAVGIDEADDAEASPQGFLEVVNQEWTKDRKLSKRPGFRRIWSVPGGAARAFMQAGNALGVVTKDSLYAFTGVSTSPQPQTLSNRSTSLDHSTLGTYWGGVRVSQVDIGYTVRGGRGYICMAWTQITEAYTTELNTNPAYEVIVRVIDELTGAVVLEATAGADRRGARVVGLIGVGKFLVFYHDASGTLAARVRVVDLSSGVWALGSQLTVDTSVSDASSTSFVPLDACAGPSNTAFVAYIKSAKLVVKKVDQNGSVTATLTSGLQPNASGAVAVSGCANGDVVVAFQDSTFVSAARWNSALSSAVAAETLVVNSTTASLISLVELSNSVVMIALSTTTDTRVHYWTSPGVAVAFKQLLNQQLLVSKLYEADSQLTSTAAQVLTVHAYAHLTEYRGATAWHLPSSTTESASPAGTVAFDEVQNPTAGLFEHNLPAVVAGGWDNDATALTAGILLAATPCILESGDALAASGLGAVGLGFVKRVRLSRLDYRATAPITTATLGRLGFASGSLPIAFDGHAFGEIAWVAPPAAPSLSSPNSGLLTGTYSYCQVWEFTDAQGNLQVSPPSPLAATTVTSKKIRIQTQMASPAVWRGIVGARLTRIKIYRTQASNSTFYLAHTYALSEAALLDIEDNVTDANLTLGETLYTTGGALESEPAPPLKHVIAHRNRLFGIRSDTPETIAFTQETTDPFYPRWHGVLTQRVDTDGGAPTALASLFDKVVVFQADAIVSFTGLGPDGTGNGSYSQPETVARGVGVASDERASVVQIPAGVLFRHKTGIQLLTPDLQVAPIGRPVEDSLGTNVVTRARYLPSRHQVWFLLADADGVAAETLLVFDTRYSRWSTWTSPVGFVDVAEHEGEIYTISDEGLFLADYDVHTDEAGEGDVGVVMRISTPWFRGGGRAAAVRLWKLHLAGKVVDLTDATVVASIYSQQQEQAAKVDTTADSTHTWDSLDDLPAGGVLLSARAVSQRCQSFRCVVEVTAETTNTSKLVELTSLTYDYGMLPSRGKAPGGRRPQQG